MSRYPFLPNEPVNIVIVSKSINENIKKVFNDNNIKMIQVFNHKVLYDAVASHPDMVCHPIAKDTVVVAPYVNEYLKTQLIQQNIKIVLGNTRLKRNYPNNIAYNVARIGGYVIHNFKYTDQVLLEYFKRENLCFIDVKQGYSKCSIAIVNDNSIITSDKGIEKKASAFGLDVLLIRPGFIKLEGLEYGFIGGACGLISKDKLMFNGNIVLHPDYLGIKAFCESKGVSVVSTKSNLEDCGSIIPI